MANEKKTAAQVAEQATAEVKKAAEKATVETKKAAEKVTADTKKAAEKVTADTKKAAEKVTANTKKVAKRAAAAVKKEVVRTAILQYDGEDYKVDDVIAKAEAAFKAENKKKAINEIKVYIKPQDHAAYYVVNDDFAGRVDL